MHLTYMQGITFWAPHEAIQNSMQSSLHTVQQDEFKSSKQSHRTGFLDSLLRLLLLLLFLLIFPYGTLENWVATKSDWQVIPNVASEKNQRPYQDPYFHHGNFLLRLKREFFSKKNKMESSLTSHIFPKDCLCTSGQVIRYGHYLQ